MRTNAAFRTALLLLERVELERMESSGVCAGKNRMRRRESAPVAL
jgi:hypothetical protein